MPKNIKWIKEATDEGKSSSIPEVPPSRLNIPDVSDKQGEKAIKAVKKKYKKGGRPLQPLKTDPPNVSDEAGEAAIQAVKQKYSKPKESTFPTFSKYYQIVTEEDLFLYAEVTQYKGLGPKGKHSMIEILKEVPVQSSRVIRFAEVTGKEAPIGKPFYLVVIQSKHTIRVNDIIKFKGR